MKTRILLELSKLSVSLASTKRKWAHLAYYISTKIPRPVAAHWVNKSVCREQPTKILVLCNKSERGRISPVCDNKLSGGYSSCLEGIIKCHLQSTLPCM